MPEGYKTIYSKLGENEKNVIKSIASNRLTETKQQVEKMWGTIDFDKVFNVNEQYVAKTINESKSAPNMLAKVCQMLQ